MAADPPPSFKGAAPVLLPLVTGLATLVASCASDAPPRPTATQRDSAGIRIVENAGAMPAADEEWRVAPTPRLTIGTVEGDTTQMLYGVTGAHRIHDGRIAVVNAGSREVRVYDAEGRFLRAWGGPGEGPEEFGSPILGGAVADTLVVVDQALHRVTLIHADAGFVRLARVADDVGGFLFPAGTLGNGQTVFGGALDMGRFGTLQNGVNRAPTFYRSSNPDGTLAADFGNKLGAEFFLRFPPDDTIPETVALVPFGKTPQATVSSTRFYFGSGDGFEIEAYDPGGALMSIIRWEGEPAPITDEDLAWYVNANAEGRDDNRARRIRRQLSEIPTPEEFPPYGGLQADALGFLWVQDYERPGDAEHRWTVFDPDGALTARVTTPKNLNILEIGADYVLAVRRDELDVEYVVLYSLTRPESDTPVTTSPRT